MEIRFYKHALFRTVDRVKKVKTLEDARIYLKEKFIWMKLNKYYKFLKVNILEGRDWKKCITNWYHYIIYDIYNGKYRIITYWNKKKI